jgi:glutamate synthase domain-containing protein 3
MRTGRDVAVAALLGAEEFGFATAPLVVLGCVMMRKCHQNTCPMGVATQDPRLRARFTGQAEHLVRYFHFVAEELRRIMADLGLASVDDMIGRSDLLEKRDLDWHWKAKHLDFSPIFDPPPPPPGVAVRCVAAQDHGIDQVMDRRLIEAARPAMDDGGRVRLSLPIRNTDRAVGTMLSGTIAKRFGQDGLPDDAAAFEFHGSAGQSFGAFAVHGLTLTLVGDSNDYIGKGLSGARIVVRPPDRAAFDPADNVIIGNVALYGATGGEAYFGGLAGERFAIRNSGAQAVVEGVGDHGCEYMTGGLVVVLGRTGVNFAAGMSGGIAFVYDPEQDFDLRCNLDMVDIEPIDQPEDVALLRDMIQRHQRYTGSPRARMLLDDWDQTLSLFVKVMPMEYRRALGQMAQEDLSSRRTDAEQVQQA